MTVISTNPRGRNRDSSQLFRETHFALPPNSTLKVPIHTLCPTPSPAASAPCPWGSWVLLPKPGQTQGCCDVQNELCVGKNFCGSHSACATQKVLGTFIFQNYEEMHFKCKQILLECPRNMLNKSRQKNVGNFWQNIVTVMVGLGKILFVHDCINKVDHLQEKKWERQKDWGNGDSELFCTLQISIVMKKYCLKHEANISRRVKEKAVGQTK